MTPTSTTEIQVRITADARRAVAAFRSAAVATKRLGMSFERIRVEHVLRLHASGQARLRHGMVKHYRDRRRFLRRELRSTPRTPYASGGLVPGRAVQEAMRRDSLHASGRAMDVVATEWSGLGPDAYTETFDEPPGAP